MSYYAVKVGRRPGVYSSYPEMKRQTDGFQEETGQRPVFKKFATLKEAQDFVKDPKAGYSRNFGPKKVPEAWVVVGPRKGQKRTTVYLLDRQPGCFDPLDEAFASLPFSNYAIERKDLEELEGKPLADDEADTRKPLRRYDAPAEDPESIYEACLKAAADAKAAHGAKKITFCNDPDSVRAWYATLDKNLEEAERAAYRNRKTGKPLRGEEHLKVLRQEKGTYETKIDERASRHLDAKKLKRKMDAMTPDPCSVPELAKIDDRYGSFDIDPKLLPERLADRATNPDFFESEVYASWIAAEKKRFYDWLASIDDESRRYFYEDVEQNSPPWHAVRFYVMSATSAEVASSTSPFKSQEGFLQNKLWSDVKARTSKAELANLERGSKNEDEARNGCLDLVREFYDSGAAVSLARFVEAFGKVRERTETLKAKNVKTFVGGIYLSPDPELVGMACSDDGIVKMDEVSSRKRKRIEFSIECKVPEKGYYDKNGGIPDYYKDQMNFIDGMRSLRFTLFSVLDLKQGLVRVRNFEASRERFQELVERCRTLHERFVEGLVLQRSGLLRYPETGPSDVVARLQRDANEIEECDQ